MIAKGRGVDKNFIEAAKWYRKAAEQGHVKSQNNLGIMYEEGEGVPQDYTQSVYWYRNAAARSAAVCKWCLSQDHPLLTEHLVLITW